MPRRPAGSATETAADRARPGTRLSRRGSDSCRRSSRCRDDRAQSPLRFRALLRPRVEHALSFAALTETRNALAEPPKSGHGALRLPRIDAGYLGRQLDQLGEGFVRPERDASHMVDARRLRRQVDECFLQLANERGERIALIPQPLVALDLD